MSHFKIIKRKAKGFFKNEDLQSIQQAVSSSHQIISNASILVRTHYLRWFQSNHPISTEDQPFEITRDVLAVACNIVQGDVTPSVRGNGKDKDAKVCLFFDMLSTYQELYGRLHDCSIPRISSGLSLSHVLSYSMENLLTAYENNIHSHFPKYPKRYILCDLLSKGVDKSVARKAAAAFTQHFMFDFPLEMPDGCNVDSEVYRFLFPEKVTVKGLPRCWDLKVHPWLYLYKMVMINQALETEFMGVEERYRKLLNPLPFHSSFVPMHVRFDTSGLSQLLMTKERIKEFKELYEIEHPEATLNMKSKADMLSSFEKLLGRPPVSNEEAGMYATDVWAFLTNLKTCRQWREINGFVRKNDPKKVTWVFDNAVVTDGVSISFQVIDQAAFGRKILTGRKKQGERVADVSKNCNVGSVDDVKPVDVSKFKVLGCDPGKRDILAITDGFTTIRYTKGQRDQDTYKVTRTKAALKRRRTTGSEVYESQVMNRYSKSSCHPLAFQRYACLRKQREEKLFQTYSHPMFRQFKFLAYTTARSSEQRFMDRVMKTFSKGQKDLQRKCASNILKANAMKDIADPKEILIGWGDWGKTPNALKCHLGPTPGIGIRKRFQRIFKTVTVNEYLTSQTCPCCKGERCLKKAKLNSSVVEEKHHLLRCTNEGCQSRWWNRNVVGSFNILSKILDQPQTQSPGNETTGSRPRRKDKLQSLELRVFVVALEGTHQQVSQG